MALLIKSVTCQQVLTPEQHEAANRNEYNFDHPGKENLKAVTNRVH